MARRFPQADIDAVRERSDIVAVISENTPLRNAGGGRFKGLCLFHDERSPSMHVTPSGNFYHCFGCGAGGDIIQLVMELNGFNFAEAVQSLADQFSITIEAKDDGTDEIVSRPTRLYDANRHAALFFKDALLNGQDALGRQFLIERSFDVSHSADNFGVGYAPNTPRSLTQHLMRLKFTPDEIVEAGLASDYKGSLYDIFQGRPTWAIKDGSGRVLGFGARRIREDDRRDAKYINTSESPVYKKSKVFYGLDRARKVMASMKQAVIVEGYTDVMSMHLAGIENTVATCGTALTENHLATLLRIVGQDGEVISSFDGDAAGMKAAMSAYSLGKKSIRRLSVLEIQGGNDPDSLRVSEGLDALRSLLPERRPLIEAVLRGTITSQSINTPEERVIALNKACEVLADVQDDILRGQYAPMVADLTRLPLSEVAKRLRVATPARPFAPPRLPQAGRSYERDALQLVAQHPEVEGARSLLDEEFYISGHARALIPVLSWWIDSGNPSPMTLLDAAPPSHAVAVREILAEPIDVSDLGMYCQELMNRLEIARVDREIGEAKARTEANPNDSEAFRSLRNLRELKAALRTPICAEGN